MQTIHTDQKLRSALYSMYVAQFEAIKAHPAGFDKNHATRMLTALMGSRTWSWRVIGITSAALQLFADHNFDRPARQVQRGHRIARSDTARELFIAVDEPMPREQFFEFFLERDKTVLMTVAQNRSRPGGVFPKFIKIPMGKELFPCGSLIGWEHRDQEKKFLRDLYTRQP